MWFKNLRVFRLSASHGLSPASLETALQKHAYKGGGGLEMQSLGWVAPREGGTLVHVVGQQMLLSLRAEKKLLPATVINQVAKARAQEIEEQQGFKPGRKQMKEIKERATDELLPKAFSIYRDTRVWIDPANGWLVIDAAAATKADEVLGMLAKALDPFPLESLRVKLSPALGMTTWLGADEAPENFSIDQDTELKASGEGRAKVRYSNQTIDLEDATRHIQAGKQCTRLAMTWACRVSFVLTDSLDVKRVAPLDILKENSDSLAQNDDEKFDSDMALMTGELAKLLADLVDALGGSLEIETPADFSLRESVVEVANDDPLFDKAVELVIRQQSASISTIQRHLRIGYNRAANLLDWMEQRLIVSPLTSSGNRTVLTTEMPT